MKDDILETIDELHIYEKKLLKSLENNENISPEEIAEEQDLSIKSVMSAAGSLSSKGIIQMKKDVTEIVSLSDEGVKYAKGELPERKILDILAQENEIPMAELGEKTGLNPKESNIAIGWLMRKKWAVMDKGNLKITERGQEFIDKLGEDEKLLVLLLEKGVSTITDTFKDGLKLLTGRKGVIESDKSIEHSFKLLDKGHEILETGFTIQAEETQLTHDQLKTGQWSEIKYRPYDINAEFPEFYPGKGHPLRRIIDEIREIFLNLGFTESNGQLMDSAFWNFDSLFQPQDHAAREMQDTFYIKNPRLSDLPDEELVKNTAKMHETGGETGSEGWQYEWSEEIAKQSVLRTHTTGISTRYLNEIEPPLKMFSVGRVFRRETITYKHLPEFHQVEGIVAGEDISFSNLLGILKEFYKKLGFEVRFRPAYFPYTYLSTECEIFLPEKDSWMELGGAGMFRPEVLEPLGIKTPVLAFGLGIERLAMVRYDIEDIRMLYKSDINWLRKIPIEKGIDL